MGTQALSVKYVKDPGVDGVLWLDSLELRCPHPAALQRRGQGRLPGSQAEQRHPRSAPHHPAWPGRGWPPRRPLSTLPTPDAPHASPRLDARPQRGAGRNREPANLNKKKHTDNTLTHQKNKLFAQCPCVGCELHLGDEMDETLFIHELDCIVLRPQTLSGL